MIDQEIQSYGRFIYLNSRQSSRISTISQSLTYINIWNTGYGYNVTRRSLGDFHSFLALKNKDLANFGFCSTAICFFYKNILSGPNSAVVYPTNSQTKCFYKKNRWQYYRSQ